MGVVCLVSTLHRAYDMAGPKSTMVVGHPSNCKTRHVAGKAQERE